MFLKPFILVFDTFKLPRQEILDYLDTCPAVKNWYAFLPTAIIIISDRNAFQLAELFRNRFLSKYFIISEITLQNHDGWLDKSIWSFIKNPQSAGRWPPNL